MDAQLIVIIAGAILFIAIIGSLLFLKGYSGKFTFDTDTGTRPRASEGEGSTQGIKSNGRFKLLTAGVGTVFAAIVAKLWSMQMVSSDHYDKLAEQNQTQGIKSNGRFKLLTAGVGTVFAAIVAKLWSMQMVSSDHYDKLAEQNQPRTVTTPAPRGRILDRNGEPIVDNRASLAVVAYRDLAENPVVVRHLANVLGMPYMAVLRNIQDNTEGAQSPHTIATDVRRSTVAYIEEHIDAFPGVSIAERTERSYPHGTLACHLVGYTGTVTQEQLDAQKDLSDEERAGKIMYQSGDVVGQSGVGTLACHLVGYTGTVTQEQLDAQKDLSDEERAGKIMYQSGDVVGQSGVEYYYENLLQGIRGEQTVKVDASGNVTGQAGAVPAEPGSDIKLTIDLKIQRACEEGLKTSFEVAERTGYEPSGGSARSPATWWATRAPSRRSSSTRRRTFPMRSAPARSCTNRATSWASLASSTTTRTCFRASVASRRSRSMRAAT